ncbi:TasA family protein [Clostridium sp. D33t1_170424_F3]|uniref:TasA family protein n=1 Tax=Clostridium sp. D33t1_170424_F3 TaxID=2787099 RepID=UPI0018A9304D|nr:TasA family protein [Clostridium sp. D33t1_170424_F3]
MKRSRIILSGVSVLLVLSLLIGGTMAWFTDTEKVNANFSAGVLDITVKPDIENQATLEFKNLRPMKYGNFENELNPAGGDNQVDANGMNVSDFAPHPVYFQPVKITNDGTLPTKVDISVNLGDPCKEGEENTNLSEDGETVRWDKEHRVACANGLEKVLKIFIYKNTGTSWERIKDVNLNKYYDDAVADPGTLATDNTEPETKTVYTTAMLPAGGDETYVIAGYLPETVGNDYQGRHYHADLMFNAYQIDEGASGGAPDVDSDRFKDNVKIEWREGGQTGELAASRFITLKSSADVSAADYAAPAGYVYDPENQVKAVTVDEETGLAVPAVIIFTVEKGDPGFSGGDGTEDNPFLIMNKRQFNKIRDYSDKFFVLGADIALGSDYVPTQSISGGLNGEYKGARYTVSYTINGVDNLGLFVNNTGVLKNLTLEGTINSSGNGVGSIAVVNAGTIENCASSVNINGTLRTDEAMEANEGKNCYFGGLVSTNTVDAALKACSYTGSINADLTQYEAILADHHSCYMHLGGLAVVNAGAIEDCSLTAPEDGANVRGVCCVGGIVSENKSTGVIRNITTTGHTAGYLVAEDEGRLFNSQTIVKNDGIYE